MLREKMLYFSDVKARRIKKFISFFVTHRHMLRHFYYRPFYYHFYYRHVIDIIFCQHTHMLQNPSFPTTPLLLTTYLPTFV